MKGATGVALVMSYLVIVESPAKANTIKGYLGSKYRVIASKGHIRDLPKSSLGIDVENGFKPHYINIRGKGDVIKELKKEAKNADKIFLATDPDREGEAISWHIAKELGIPADKACRITFNETTKGAVKEAIKCPRAINEELVNSQQARRILDRVVGFKLSELLWKNVKGGLSGGRVQSVAARIIAEREEEIRSFEPVEYWTIEADLSTKGEERLLTKLYSDSNGRIKLENEEQAKSCLESINKGSFKVSSVKHSAKQKIPAPPFTTSTMQQEASRRLGFQSQRIMKVAQELYEGLNLGSNLGGVQGLITYMRTDSLRISETAKQAAAEYITANFGEEYLPRTARVYKTNANAQDAHEAIRPSNVNLTPKLVKNMLSSDQYRLYKLIWERFVASQMENAVLDTVSIEVENSGYVFRTGGYTVKSKGYLVLYADEAADDLDDTGDLGMTNLPKVKKGEELSRISVDAKQHFTEAPPRYTEASLIKFLEENGIGRPSTYAPILSILTARKYVRRDGKSLVGTPLGELTVEYMKKHFPEIIDYEFTASLETKLDSIEQGGDTIENVLNSFWGTFSVELEQAKAAPEEKLKAAISEEESDIVCERCGAKMIYKEGKFGRFLACPNFPSCRNTVTIDKDGVPVKKPEVKFEPAGFTCDLCGAEMVIRNGRYGSFYACSNYPQCKNTKQRVVEIGVNCPKCSSPIVAKKGKGKSLFYSCSKYPECDFSTWDLPLKESCPDCGSLLYYKKSRKCVVCKNDACNYKRDEEITES